MAALGEDARQFDHALSLHRDGEFDRAEFIYRAILAEDATHFDALLHLGTLQLQQGKADAAVELIRRAIANRASSAEAHSNLATALYAQRQFEPAIASYEEALSIDPDHAGANYGLGSTLCALGRMDEAIACYRRAVAVDPDYAEAEFSLGVALRDLKRNAEAADHFRAALAIDPDYVEARHELGRVLETMGEHADALTCFDAILAADPNHIQSLNQRGLVLQSLCRHEEALGSYQQALALEPRGETLLRMGVALREIGRIEQAHAAIEQAIDLQPRNPNAYVALFRSKPIAADDPYVAKARALEAEMDAFSALEQEELHFALGKVSAALVDPDCSFRHFVAGNRLKRQRIAYDERARLALHARLGRMFSADFIRSRRGCGHGSTLPVFIVGMPRSGSTLVEQILASHPKVAGGGERPDFGQAIAALGADSEAAPFPSRIPTLTGDDLRRLGELYLARLDTAIPADRSGVVERVTDKMLENFAMVGLIHLALPRARIIWTLRNPIETCLSCFTTVFADVPYACDLGELGRYYRACEAMRQHWASVLPAEVILEVQYEEVVRDFEAQAKRILAHCGLEWDPACLDFHTTDRPVRTASAAQVRQPIYHSSIERRRPDAILLKPLLDSLDMKVREQMTCDLECAPGGGHRLGNRI